MTVNKKKWTNSKFMNTFAEFVNKYFNMMKRRTSKRFVLGESNEQQSFDDGDPTEVLPNLTQKFQMTLSMEDEERQHEAEKRQQDGRLLRTPSSGTMK